MRLRAGLLLLCSGCGPMYYFEVRSDDGTIATNDVIVYRIVSSPSVWSAGGLVVTCSPNRCRTSGSSADELAEGAEATVWLDVNRDDLQEWAETSPADILALTPDDADPRTTFNWTRGLGVRRLVVDLKTPQDAEPEAPGDTGA